jgi:hypothetical protein
MRDIMHNNHWQYDWVREPPQAKAESVGAGAGSSSGSSSSVKVASKAQGTGSLSSGGAPHLDVYSQLWWTMRERECFEEALRQEELPAERYTTEAAARLAGILPPLAESPRETDSSGNGAGAASGDRTNAAQAGSESGSSSLADALGAQLSSFSLSKVIDSVPTWTRHLSSSSSSSPSHLPFFGVPLSGFSAGGLVPKVI